MMRLIFEDHLASHGIHLVKFDASGKRLAVLDRRGIAAASLFVYERTNTGWRQLASPVFPEIPRCIAFSPEGSRILVSAERKLLKFDVGSRKAEECFTTDGGEASELEWFDNDWVAAAYPDHWPPVQLLSLKDKNAIPLAPPLGEVAKHFPRIAVSHDLLTLAFCHSFEFVFLFDLRNRNVSRWGDPPLLTKSIASIDKPWEWTHFARRIWFSAQDSEIAVSSQPRGKDEWDDMGICIGSRDGTNQRLLRIKSHMGSVDFSPDFDVVAAAVSGQPGDVALCETRKSGVREILRVGLPTRDIRFSENGQLLAITCEESIAIFER